MEVKRYKIIYKGKTAQGRQTEEVKRNLASLFKLGNERIEQLFSGRPVIVANNVDYESSMKYKTAFETAGAICRVEEIKGERKSAPPPKIDGNEVTISDPSRMISCPKCGFEQEKIEECRKCGIIIGKYSDTEEDRPQVIPRKASPLFFSVSRTKLILMSIFTLGIYEVYWFYKNWVQIKTETRQNIRPFWRAIFGVLFCHALFKEVQGAVDSNGSRIELNPGWLALGYIAISITYKLPDPFWAVSLLTFLPLLPIQGTINSINAKVSPTVARNSHFSVKNIIVMIIGGFCLTLAVLDMTVSPSFFTSTGQSAWEEFTSEDGHFTISFPGKPEKEAESIDTQVGKINRQTLLVEHHGGRTAYLVMHIDYPRDAVEMVSYDQILDNVRDDLMATYRGRVNKEKPFLLNNYPGREFGFKGTWENRPVFGNVRTFLVEQRLYMLMALGAEEEVDKKDAEKFFVSFVSFHS